jgi:hypothetical protein
MSNSVHRRLRVFLCHSSTDKTVVRDFYELLHNEKWIDPWLDEEKLRWGAIIAIVYGISLIMCLIKGHNPGFRFAQRKPIEIDKK